jgi:diguanylate cyclase (GGDEF)-like protein
MANMEASPERCNACDKESLEAQVKALKDLIEVAKAVVSTLDLDTVLQAIMTSAMRFAGTPAGSVALYDDKKQELNLHVHSGLTSTFVKNERWEVKPGGLTEKVLHAGEIFFVEDIQDSPEFITNTLILEEGIKSLICVPLAVHKRVVGVLYLDDFVPREFDREKMRLLSVLASFAAMAIYNATLHNRTKLMAITDALTGLYNHRYFKQIFAQEMVRAKRYMKSLSIILLDIDDFKKYNDTFGHANGDVLLTSIGEIIMKTIRSVDYAFRYGGEEFALILPETKLASAVHVAERLRERIERETTESLKDVCGSGVTVSVGVATYPDNGNQRKDLFAIADGLLYKAKEFGKNKVYYITEDDRE